MNIYLDFDRTIYNTDKLYKDMMLILSKYNIKSDTLNEYKTMYFSEPILFNIFKLMEYICEKLCLSKKIIKKLYKIMNNGNKYIYDDVLDFLINLKQKGYIINILTYGDLDFQISKMLTIDLNDYIDSIIITKNYKFNININYKNSIFIDDNPRDIIGLYKNNAKKIIRIKRKNSKYYNEKLNIKNIETIINLKEINIDNLNK